MVVDYLENSPYFWPRDFQKMNRKSFFSGGGNFFYVISHDSMDGEVTHEKGDLPEEERDGSLD